MLLLNQCLEAGERLYSTTGAEGREGVRLQAQDLQSSVEDIFDTVSR